MAIIWTGLQALNASTNRCSTSSFSLMPSSTSSMPSWVGGSFVERSLLSRRRKGPIMGVMTPCYSSTNASVKTVRLYSSMVSMLSFKVLAISEITMFGLANHSQFQSFNLARILLSGRFSSALP